MSLFDVTKRLEYGTKNPIVARLTVQPSDILNQTTMSKADQAAFAKLSLDEMAPHLLRCYEIEQRLRAEAAKCREKFKPPGRGDVAVEIPQLPNLKAECENFLYEIKNALRDLLKLVNLLWGTQYEDASEWVKGKKGRPSVQQFLIDKFGDKHPNAAFIRQYQGCIEPLPLMRDGVEHPQSSQLVLKNFTREGQELRQATWSLEKNGEVEYQPTPIIEDMSVAIKNLLILAEDVLVMWAQINLVASQLVEVRVVPEIRRNVQCPVKFGCGRPMRCCTSSQNGKLRSQSLARMRNIGANAHRELLPMAFRRVPIPARHE
jgi:hypothetical protein